MSKKIEDLYDEIYHLKVELFELKNQLHKIRTSPIYRVINFLKKRFPIVIRSCVFLFNKLL